MVKWFEKNKVLYFQKEGELRGSKFWNLLVQKSRQEPYTKCIVSECLSKK